MQGVKLITFGIMFLLYYLVFLTMEEINSSIICSTIHVMALLPNMRHNQFMTLGWDEVDR